MHALRCHTTRTGGRSAVLCCAMLCCAVLCYEAVICRDPAHAMKHGVLQSGLRLCCSLLWAQHGGLMQHSHYTCRGGRRGGRSCARRVGGGGHTRTVAEADRPEIATTPLKRYAASAGLYSMRVLRCSVLDTVDALITTEASNAKNT